MQLAETPFPRSAATEGRHLRTTGGDRERARECTNKVETDVDNGRQRPTDRCMDREVVRPTERRRAREREGRKGRFVASPAAGAGGVLGALLVAVTTSARGLRRCHLLAVPRKAGRGCGPTLWAVPRLLVFTSVGNKRATTRTHGQSSVAQTESPKLSRPN
jgi:hypothetical protein